MKWRKIIRIIIILIIITPVIMWLVWLISPKKKLVIAIIDKTVLSAPGQEHISLDWILHYEKYSKTRTKLYKVKSDYFGFDPGNGKQFLLKGLENLDKDKLVMLSNLCDATYFTDTYGIYSNEWGRHVSLTAPSGKIYGGMSSEDMNFLEAMKNKGKLIITEYNDIGSPTTPEIRSRFESLFGVHWTGWVAKYFNDLDTSRNKELPEWLIRNYREQHDGKWPFHRSGIAFVSLTDQVEILENKTDLLKPVPQILTFQYGQKQFDLPRRMKYPYWMDIITFNDSVNHAIAAYEIYPNQKGKKLLQQYGLPERFPAVVMHNGKDYKFYYLCGDYSDNPIVYSTSYLKGITALDWLFYDQSKPDERKSFFWKFYRPMITHILKDYYKELKDNKR